MPSLWSLVLLVAKLLVMLCNVVFRSLDDEGQSMLIEENVDLDYYNIRHWRALYLRFLNYQKENGSCRLEIIPTYTLPF